MAHVILTVSQYEAGKTFYGRLMPALGMENVFDGSDMCYFVGARTALGIQPCLPEHAGERFQQGRAMNSNDRKIGAKAFASKKTPEWPDN